MSTIREKLKVGLRERVEESYRTKDQDWGKGIFDPDKTKGLQFFKPSAGQHIIDILPYLSGAHDPRRRKGESNYLVDIYVHQNIGPNEDTYICLAKSYNRPCPICEERNELRRTSGDQDEIKSLRPKRRVIYAIWDRDNETKGIQVWEVAHWFMEANLLPLAKRPRGGGYVAFTYPDKSEGRHVVFEIKGTGQNIQYTGHQLIEREEDIPDEILEKVPVLDELLYIPDYKEVKTAYLGKGGANDEGQEPEHGDEHEEDLPKFNKPVKKKVCPYGGTMGTDYGELDECQECMFADDCKPTPSSQSEKPTLRRRREFSS
jgi:hypothetical protein